MKMIMKAVIVIAGTLLIISGCAKAIMGERITITSEDLTDVKVLDVNMSCGELIIKPSEDNVGKVVAEGIVEKYFSYSYSSQGELIINGNVGNKSINNMSINYDPVIIVYVPKDTELDQVRINVAAGNVEIDELLSTKLDIVMDTGTISGSNMIATDSGIKANVGTIELSNLTTETIQLECVAGEIKIGAEINGDASLTCETGRIDLDLVNDKTDFNYNIDCGVGEIMVDGEAYGGLNVKQNISNNAENTLMLNCDVGQINVVTSDR